VGTGHSYSAIGRLDVVIILILASVDGFAEGCKAQRVRCCVRWSGRLANAFASTLALVYVLFLAGWLCSLQPTYRSYTLSQLIPVSK
jgi:hypothetical protein